MSLKLATGQYSSAGRKASNQDFHGMCLPVDRRLATKGVAVALADGISSSPVSQQASQAAVTGFLEDYYCTSDAWSVRHAVERVLAAVNSWLFAQTQQGQGRYDHDRGWACTFSAMVVKSRTAHLFHVGDARVYRVQGRTLEQLTTDHRVHAGGGQTFLGRAFGIGPQVEIDYRTIPLETGDTFILATDGVHAHVGATAMAAILAAHGPDLDQAARAMAHQALEAGSEDNVTVQVVRVEGLPDAQASEVARLASELPLPPLLAPRAEFDGYRVVRELHASSRSHVYLAVDGATQQAVVIKTPATDQSADPAYLERFLLEEWVARRVDSPHLLKPWLPERPRSFLYVAMEYVEGQTLTQWMVDHPRPSLDEVRAIVDQIARGLRTLHRAEMIHQDLRPDNVLIDKTGTARIIDFGATQVAAIMDVDPRAGTLRLPGTAQYMAPEYFLAEAGSPRSDLFSLATITYQMLTGRLPYGLEMAACRTLREQKRLRWRPAHELRIDVPAWVDDAIRTAAQVEPHRRQADVAEFVFALHRPGAAAGRERRVPLVQRDPVIFWKALALTLAVACVALLGLWVSR